MITNSNDHIIKFWDLLDETIEFRKSIDVNTVNRYWVKIIDEYLCGILPSELVVIWAESWVGKSEFAYNIAIENAARGKKVLLLALEGDVQEIAMRFLQREINKMCVERGVDPIKSLDYRFNISKEDVQIMEFQVIEEMKENIKNNLFIFNKKEVPTLEFVKDLIKTMAEVVDLTIIDHLHYIHMDAETETRELGKVMRELKLITDIIRKPIVLVSHMRKRSWKFAMEDPTMHDLYGSSNIAKEATTIILLRKREKAERAMDLPTAIQEDNRYMANKIIIEKSRIWLPTIKFQMLYDRDKRMYVDQYCELIEKESGVKKEEKLNLDNYKI